MAAAVKETGPASDRPSDSDDGRCLRRGCGVSILQYFASLSCLIHRCPHASLDGVNITIGRTLFFLYGFCTFYLSWTWTSQNSPFWAFLVLRWYLHFVLRVLEEVFFLCLYSFFGEVLHSLANIRNVLFLVLHSPYEEDATCQHGSVDQPFSSGQGVVVSVASDQGYAAVNSLAQ